MCQSTWMPFVQNALLASRIWLEVSDATRRIVLGTVGVLLQQGDLLQ